MPKDFKENFGQRSTSVQSGWPVIHKNKVFTKSATKTMAMTTIRTTTAECFFCKQRTVFHRLTRYDLETDTICVGLFAKLRSPLLYISGVDRVYPHIWGISISCEYRQRDHYRQESVINQLLRRRQSSWTQRLCWRIFWARSTSVQSSWPVIH